MYGCPVLAIIFLALWIITVIRIPKAAKELIKARKRKYGAVAILFNAAGGISIKAVPAKNIISNIMMLGRDDMYFLPKTPGKENKENPGEKSGEGSGKPSEEELAIEEIITQKYILEGGVNKPCWLVNEDKSIAVNPRTVALCHTAVNSPNGEVEVKKAGKPITVKIESISKVLTKSYYRAAMRVHARLNQYLGQQMAGKDYTKITGSFVAIIAMTIIAAIIIKMLFG